jgi:hypothetical protein
MTKKDLIEVLKLNDFIIDSLLIQNNAFLNSLDTCPDDFTKWSILQLSDIICPEQSNIRINLKKIKTILEKTIEDNQCQCDDYIHKLTLHFYDEYTGLTYIKVYGYYDLDNEVVKVLKNIEEKAEKTKNDYKDVPDIDKSKFYELNYDEINFQHGIIDSYLKNEKLKEFNNYK